MLLINNNPISIVMVTYHRPNDFKMCVESIIKHTHIPYHLSIIDNSNGAIDKYLDHYVSNNITIYKNKANIGKAAAINKWFRTITINDKHPFFISIDSDIIVQKGWLTEMVKCYYTATRTVKVGVLAPAICNSYDETWELQIKHNKPIMHNIDKIADSHHIYKGLYYNVTTSGSLIVVNTKFFLNNGMYYDKRLYGGDDGQLCLAAAKSKLFVGINSNLLVKHTNNDSDEQYIKWKARNINGNINECGRWD